MSKLLSFKGQLPIGVQEKIKLATMNGKTGYKLTKFKIMSATPGVGSVEYVAKIYTKDQTNSITDTVDFTEGDLIAAIYYQDDQNTDKTSSTEIILDMVVFNQDIFVYIESPNGSTVQCNYYIEVETMTLTDIQSTQLTLKNLRSIAAR